MLLKTALWTPFLFAIAGQPSCMIDDFGGMGRYNRDFHYSFPMTTAGRLSVETFNGATEISAWDQPNVDISGTKYAPTQQEADNLQVDVDHTPDSVSIRVMHSVDWHGNRGCRFAIKIPRG